MSEVKLPQSATLPIHGTTQPAQTRENEAVETRAPSTDEMDKSEVRHARYIRVNADSPFSVKAVTSYPNQDSSGDGKVNRGDQRIVVRNDSGSAQTLPKGTTLAREGLLWDSTVARLREDITLAPHGEMVIMPRPRNPDAVREQLQAQGQEVVFTDSRSLGLTNWFFASEYIDLIAPNGSTLGELHFDPYQDGEIPTRPSKDTPVIMVPEVPVRLEATDRPEVASLPVVVTDFDTIPSNLVVRVSGSFQPKGGSDPISLPTPSFDLRTGSISFLQRPGEGTYRFELSASDGDHVRRAILEVNAEQSNRAPTIAVNDHHVVEFRAGREHSIPVSIGDPEQPASELTKMAQLNFVGTDGKSQQLGFRFADDGTRLYFSPPGVGTVSAELVAVDRERAAAVASTEIDVDLPPTASFAFGEKKAALGAEPIVVGFEFDDPHPQQKDQLKVEWLGIRTAPDGTETEFQPEVVGDNGGVRLIPDKLGEYRVIATVTDPSGFKTEAIFRMEVFEHLDPVLNFDPVWRLTSQGTGTMRFPLDIQDPDTPLDKVTATLDRVDLRWWRDNSQTRYDYNQTPYSRVVKDGEQFFLETKIWSVNGDYDAHLTLQDDDGNVSSSTARVHLRTQNTPPQLELPGNKAWRAGTAERSLPIRITDADLSAAKVEITCQLAPRDGGESVEIPVRRDAAGNMLFDPAGPESKEGTYNFAVEVTDPHGASAEGGFQIRVADEFAPPTVQLPETVELDAGLEDSVHVMHVPIADPDTPLAELDISVTGEVRFQDEAGNNVRRPIYPELVRTSEGVDLHIPVRGAVDSDTSVRVEVTDDSNQVTAAETVLHAKLPAMAPVVDLGPNREITTSDEPVRLPINVYDPNRDDVDIVPEGKFTPADGGTPRAIVPRIVRADGQLFLELDAKEPGTYDLAVAATEKTSEALSTRATLQIQATKLDDRWVKTPLWARARENEFSADRQHETGVLEGVPPGTTTLRAMNLYIKGMQPFEPGHPPRDAHSTPTENHDSFDQSVAWSGFTAFRKLYESLGLPMSFEKLIAAKAGRQEIQANINAMADTNAYYSMGSEQITTGRSGGKWDLGADLDVLIHELGHWLLDHTAPGLVYAGASGAMHEGGADGLASLLFRDPEISEDFGKVRGGWGTPLREADQVPKATTSNTSSEVHDRGKVYAGVWWEIAETLHTRYTGKPRDRSTDVERLDPRASADVVKILASYGQYLGSTNATAADFERSVRQAITSLGNADNLGKHLPAEERAKLVADLSAFVTAECVERGLVPKGQGLMPTVSRGLPIDLPEARSNKAALAAALEAAGFSSSFVPVRSCRATGPNGEAISRYQLNRAVQIDGREVLRPIADDYLTLIRKKDGTYQAQLGTLPEISRRFAAQDASRETQHPGIELPADDRAVQLRSSTVSSIVTDLKQRAARDLQAMLAAAKGTLKAHERPVGGIAGGDAIQGPDIIAAAQTQLKNGGDITDLVWENGLLMVSLDLDTVKYKAPVTRAGGLGDLARQSGVISEEPRIQAGMVA